MTKQRLGRWLTGQALVALIVLLPALVAGASVGSAPAPGEWERLVAAVEADKDRPHSQVADGFVRAFAIASDAPEAAGTEAAPVLLATARLAQVLAVLAVSMSTYLVVVVASGRARALGTVLFLAVLPPIAGSGHVLRPETAVTVFALLGVLLLQLLAINERPAASRRRLVSTALGLSASFLLALAVATMPSAGPVLLVPAGALVLSAGQLVLRMLRVLRQRHVATWPARAAAGRMWPWATTSIATLAFAALLMLDGVHRPEAMVASAVDADLLPRFLPARLLLLGIALLGALRLVLRTGQRFGRRARLSADLLLLVFVAATLSLAGFRERGLDVLPAAPAMALLLVDGSVAALLAIARRRPRR